MPDDPQPSSLAPLGREEYVEQSHFFRALAERLEGSVPAQEVLGSVREEILATTKLPLAIDFLLGELKHEGVLGPAVARLPHYFTPFQAFVIRESENEKLKFDLRVGLEILRREAAYKAEEPTRQGIFLYQFESLCRHRLGYDRGLEAVAGDPAFDDVWRKWILKLRRQIGMVDLADVIYVHSEYYWLRADQAGEKRIQHTDSESQTNSEQRTKDATNRSEAVILFGEREGRIALANRKKDPLFLFSALHRQLGYPEVPRAKPVDHEKTVLAQMARRMEQMEMRLKILEEEQRGGLDITKFYKRPDGKES